MKAIEIGDLVAYRTFNKKDCPIELGIYLGRDYESASLLYNHMVYWTIEGRVGYEPASDLAHFRETFLTHFGNTDTK